ncbi:MAG: hypothetical protein ACPGEC_05700, partial [Flavobacteriales bacterium]
MKKLLFLSLVALQGFAFAQKQLSTEVSFDDLRLPLQPLEGLENYFFTVSTPYPENNDHLIQRAKEKHSQDSLRFPQVVQESELKYKEALAELEIDTLKSTLRHRIAYEEAVVM